MRLALRLLLLAVLATFLTASPAFAGEGSEGEGCEAKKECHGKKKDGDKDECKDDKKDDDKHEDKQH